MPYFNALFTDGSRIIQDNDNDISESDQSKSRFYDVLSKLKIIELKEFRIVLPELDSSWGVDLQTGLFFISIHGVKSEFKCEPGSAPMNIVGPFELIYYKDITQTLDLENGKTTKAQKYRIGWRAGKFTQTIIVG